MSFTQSVWKPVLAALRSRLLPLIKQCRSRSLIEILLALTAGSSLIFLLSAGILNAQRSVRDISCVSNMRQIHQAMNLYLSEYQSYPIPSTNQTLKAMLDPWLKTAPQVFHCPDDQPDNPDSYSYYYAPRTDSTEGDCYVLGCPRHHKYSRGVVLFAAANASVSPSATILHDDTPVEPGDEFDYGQFKFADGSTATIGNGKSGAPSKDKNSNAPDLPAITPLISIRNSNGTYHSVIKMKDGMIGTVTFSIVPGNRFEVVTPSAVIAVRGTQFSVETLKQGGKPATRVVVTSGVVDMDPVGKGRALKIAAGKKALCIQGESPEFE